MASDLESKCLGLKKDVEYWKSEATKLKKKYEDQLHKYEDQVQENDELVQTSKEIENELEAQIEAAEKETKELRRLNTSLTFDKETLQERLEKETNNRYKQVGDLQDECSKLKERNKIYAQEVRELEQKNDDMERTNRMIIATLTDFEQKLNIECERNALLESELVEKNDMVMTVQRLRDEARDLSEELHIRDLKQQQGNSKKQHDNKENNKKEQKDAPINQSTPTKLAPATPTSLTANHKPPRLSPMMNGHNNNNVTSSMTSSTPDNRRVHLNGNIDVLAASPRVYALNIVGDLLRKVGALESKLASCRNIVLDNSSRNMSTSSLASSATSSTTHRSSLSNTENNNSNENNNNNNIGNSIHKNIKV